MSMKIKAVILVSSFTVLLFVVVGSFGGVHASSNDGSYRQMQVSAAIRFCDVLFGHDYASLMSRAAENAATGERKPSRAG